jgi:hypothetical protein
MKKGWRNYFNNFYTEFFKIRDFNKFRQEDDRGKSSTLDQDFE